jgi:hypothetical protein
MCWWSKIHNLSCFQWKTPSNLITKLLKINGDLQFEITIEENTIHDQEFAKTLQRLKREIKFQKS